MSWQQLYERIAGTPWTSWISHGVVTLGLLALTHEPAAVALFWPVRELEQVFLELLYKRPVDVKDHIMDTLVPWLVIVAWVLL